MKSSSSASTVPWQAPPVPAGFPWPAPPHMAAMPPMGVRPPMMFAPPPAAGFPPGHFQRPPRLPFNTAQDIAAEENEESGADGEIGESEGTGGGGDDGVDEGKQRDADDGANVPHMGNFPRPMGSGDWRLRAPGLLPLIRGPNMPRPDLMRGPRPLLGDSRGPPGPRAFLPAPPPARFAMPQNFEEEEDEEYYCLLYTSPSPRDS